MKGKLITLILCSLTLSLFLYSYGEAGFIFNNPMINELRIPKILACVFGGGLLALSGMLMQILFQNPLAGPDILGISSGASLFVAIGIILRPFLPEQIQALSIGMMSFLGAFIFLLLILFFIFRNISKTSLLIIGILLSSFTSSFISLVINIGNSSGLRNYLTWSMGTFRSLSFENVPVFIGFSFLAILPMIFLVKSLSQILLSDQYAKSMGLDIKKLKYKMIILIALQVAIVTYYCGPIGFIGIISPHVTKMFIKKINFSILIPSTFLIGSIFALIVEAFLTCLPNIPLSANAILGLLGAPLIAYLLLKRNTWGMR